MHFKHLLVLLLLSVLGVANAQVTTSSLYGSVTDEKGAPLPGATVIATHVPTGTQYAVTTRSEGQYTLPNMRVGGPYTVEVTYVGFKAEKAENLFLTLGQKLPAPFVLKIASAQLNEVTVKASDALNDGRTGLATTIGSDQLRTLPTIKRSIFDYTRLNPAAGDNGTFGGRLNRFNNFSLNGAIFTNPFGLDAAQPGGQTDAQPVSLDAIEQIQVSLSPFDITQAGFVGASINAVTKSGTNTLSGTAFGFFRNQSLTGKRVKGTDIIVPESGQTQAGFSLGGPIIKNKLFFFINAEADVRSDLGTDGWVAARSGLSGANVSRVTSGDLETVGTALRALGYEPGAYENYTHRTRNVKAVVKLDWNINSVHKLSFMYNMLDAFRDKPAHPSAIGRRGPDLLTLQFANSGYRINNKLHGGILELNSNFNGRFANKLQVGYTAFRDARDPMSSPFPVVNINKDGVRYIVAGHEPFSINNRLTQDVFQVTNNFNIYAGKHTITLGAAFERFSFDNSFNLNAYDGTFGPGFSSVQDFVTASRTADYRKTVDAAKATFGKGQWALAETNVGQFGLYAQDEVAVSPRLNLSYGLRVDMPMYFDTEQKIEENLARACCYDPKIQYYNADGKPVLLDSKKLPGTAPLISPRVGFNYKIDASSTLRGGTGVFTGRFPFVWIGNQVANPNFFFYTTTDPSFKFPQVWKTSLGYDRTFKNGWRTSFDALYSYDLQNMMVRNYGLKTPSARLQQPASGTLTAPNTVDTRPVYALADRSQIFGGPTNAYVFTNVSGGYSLNLSAQVQRTWATNLFMSLAYNYLYAIDKSSTDSEISSDSFDRQPTTANANTPVSGFSQFGNQHRVVGTIGKKFVYGGGDWATTISAVAEYAKGGRFSYTYFGDLNNDGSGLNDLLFIPTNSQVDQMKFEGNDAQQNAQRAGFKSFIAQDEYLSSRQGQYAERYASLSPWYSNWDVRILQDYNLPNKKLLQLSIDVLNAGNLISSNWGVRQIASYTGLAQPLGVRTDASGVPIYSFDTSVRSTFFNDTQLTSRWRMQVGLRLTF
ncbi:MAG: TonB-dependent receptor [Cytophagales bacterium]|nr:MAG: TonB-dependent receptor [Cytophagales bacterium]